MLLVRSIVLLLGVVGAAVVCPGQRNVIELAGVYHVGLYTCRVGDPGFGQGLSAAVGTATFLTTGTHGVTFIGRDIVPSGATSFVESYGGGYTVSLSGGLGLQLTPGEWWHGAVDSRGEVLHATRRDVASPMAFGMIAIRASTNHSTAAVQGTYQLRTLTARNDTHPVDGHRLRVVTSSVTATLDGLGSAFPVGAYSVTSSGRMTLGGATGAATANGDAFFVVHGATSGDAVGMTVGVRVELPPADVRRLQGRWSAHALGLVENTNPQLPPELPQSTTDWFEFSLATPGAGGTFSLSVTAVSTHPLPNPNSSSHPNGPCPGNTQGPCTWLESSSASGWVNATGGGYLGLQPGGGGAPILDLWVADTGRFCVGSIPGEHALLFGIKQSGPASAYGTHTPGSGGIAPVLGMRGFPDLGNATFGYELSDGLGAAPAALAIGFAASPGVPLSGGLLFVDPLSIVNVPFLVLGGPPQPGVGVTFHGVPIPNSSWLVGVNLFAQGLVLDPGAAAGLALTRGLHVVFAL